MNWRRNPTSLVIIDELRKFGLSEKEIYLYLTLLEMGPSTIIDLSRETGIKRSTTHANVDVLIQKGLVTQSKYGERRRIVAEDAEKLFLLIEEKKWDIRKLEHSLDDVIGQLLAFIPPETHETN